VNAVQVVNELASNAGEQVDGHSASPAALRRMEWRALVGSGGARTSTSSAAW
jgi:hypothetical protein